MDLAQALGVNKDTVLNWETGRTEPRLAVLGHRAVAVVQQIAGVALEEDTARQDGGQIGAFPHRRLESSHSRSLRTLSRQK